MADSVRLNKYLAQNGISSRRGADELVFAGRISVNGTVAESPGIRIVPGKDEIAFDGKSVAPTIKDAVTLLLHKPVQTVTTVKDPQGRKTVMDFLPEDIRSMRPFPVGRLDFFSEGLLLLTTDGDLCHRLTHPKWHMAKIYRVTIRGRASKEALETMRTGMTLSEGEKLAPVKVRAFDPQSGTQTLEMTLMQGVNRQIRRMCRELDLTILKLKRIQQGPIKLGSLKSGTFRQLDREELKALKKNVGF